MQSTLTSTQEIFFEVHIDDLHQFVAHPFSNTTPFILDARINQMQLKPQ